MIVRIVTYGARSLEAVREWLEERADDVESVPGLERVAFVREATPPRAGAIMYFESADDLRQYKESRRFEWLQESIREDWATDAEPVQDIVYRVMEVSEGRARTADRGGHGETP